jgi:hypothetical protein
MSFLGSSQKEGKTSEQEAVESGRVRTSSSQGRAHIYVSGCQMSFHETSNSYLDLVSSCS